MSASNVIDIEEEKAIRIERMEAEPPFASPRVLLLTRCACGNQTAREDGRCPWCPR